MLTISPGLVLFGIGFLCIIILIIGWMVVKTTPNFSIPKEAGDDWLTAEGILEARVRREPKHVGGYVGIKPIINPNFFRPYRPEFFVVYMVNGKTYMLRWDLWLAGSLFRESAAKEIEQYTSGQRVIVRYDPRNPQNAVVVSDIHAKPEPME